VINKRNLDEKSKKIRVWILDWKNGFEHETSQNNVALKSDA
jgi:hypothetical protein